MLSAQVRVRQHVNPLASRFQAPLSLPPGWYAATLTDAAAPLHLDIGCGKGRWALATAAAAAASRRRVNVLGLEIRAPLVEQANGWAAAAAADAAAAGADGADGGWRNVAFLAANANVVLADLLGGGHVPAGVLASASVQFPDPHFKRRHRKRRTLTPALAATLAAAMPPGGELLIQSDVRAVADGMCGVLEAPAAAADWAPATGRGGVWAAGPAEVEAVGEDGEPLVDGGERPTTDREWLVDNPTGIPTEREVSVLAKGGDVYRRLYVRR